MFRKLLLLIASTLFVASAWAGDWYTASGVPSTGSQGSSATMRGEFNLINTAMDKLPTVTANGLKGVFVNSGGTALESVTAATARTNLGLVIGTDAQAWDNDLDDLAALLTTDGNIIVGNGTDWIAESGATARTSLGVAIGSNVQAWDDDLDDLAALAPTDSNFIVGNGTDWIVESGATVRTSLGLGSMATQTANNVAITGGSVVGITDLLVLDGGTGASALQTGGVLLGSGTGAITAMSVLADGAIIVGDGTTDPVAESGATARTSLGAAASGANSDITSITGLTTDLAIVHGGTGASTAAGALTNLGITATAAELNLNDGAVLRHKVIEIGDWNMDTTAVVNVSHGLTLSKIRQVSAMIRRDSDTFLYQLTGSSGFVSPIHGSVKEVSVGFVVLQRTITENYDNANFDSTSYNRGWVTVWYVD